MIIVRHLALALLVAATTCTAVAAASPASATELSAPAPLKARIAHAPRRSAMPPQIRLAARYEAMLRGPCYYSGCRPYALMGVGYQW
jgi:hypothetical protein